MCAVNGTAFKADAVQCGLDDDVLFRVNRPADFSPCTGRDILLIAQAAQFQTVFQAGRRTVVSRW